MIGFWERALLIFFLKGWHRCAPMESSIGKTEIPGSGFENEYFRGLEGASRGGAERAPPPSNPFGAATSPQPR